MLQPLTFPIEKK